MTLKPARWCGCLAKCLPAPKRPIRAPAAGVAAVAMNTNAVAAPKKAAVPVAVQQLKAAFILALGGLLVAVRTIFLPHLLAAVVLFALAFYGAYQLCGAWMVAPFSWITGGVLFVGYGAVALLYALATSLVFALRSAAVNVEDFLYALFGSLKDKVRSKIDSMEEGMAKQQARVILENSVREVFAPLKEFRLQAAPAVAAGILVWLLSGVTRSVFLARLARISGATVNFSAIFASRATLVGALILNFRWLATGVLWILYAAGALVFVLNIWLLW